MSKITRIPELPLAASLSGSELIALTQQNVTSNAPVSAITKTENENILSLYSYVVSGTSSLHQNFTSNTLEDFITTEWSPALNINHGDTVALSANNQVYILIENDGSSVNDYLQVTLKPNTLIYKTNIQNYGTLDTISLSTIGSAKYISEVTDRTSNDLHYSELNVVSNGSIAVICEYGINSTTSIPFVEYGVRTNTTTVILTAVGINGSNANNFTFKINKINLF